MVHHDCDPTGQSSLSSPHSSSSPSLGGMGAGTGADDATGGSQSVSATAAGPGYLCPSCRNRGSNTPSEVSFWLDISTPLFPGLTSPIHL